MCSMSQPIKMVGPYKSCGANSKCYEPAEYSVGTPYSRRRMDTCGVHLAEAVTIMITITKVTPVLVEHLVQNFPGKEEYSERARTTRDEGNQI